MPQDTQPLVERYRVYAAEPVTTPELNPYGARFRQVIWRCRPFDPG